MLIPEPNKKDITEYSILTYNTLDEAFAAMKEHVINNKDITVFAYDNFPYIGWCSDNTKIIWRLHCSKIFGEYIVEKL